MGRISNSDRKKEVWRMFEKHTKVPKSVAEWAKRNAFSEGRAYQAYKEGRYWCSDCGQVVDDIEANGQTATCPHCGARLATPQKEPMVWGRGVTRRCDYAYIQRFTVIQGWQVIQEFATTKYSVRGKAAEYTTTLVYEHWLNGDKKKAYLIGRFLKVNPSWQEMPFSLNSAFNFKNFGYWYEGWRDKYFPVKRMAGFLTRFNCQDYRQFFGVNGSDEELYRAYCLSPVIAETLYKTGEIGFGQLFFSSPNYRSKIIKYWRTILVARRHGYLSRLSGTLALRDWLDYVDELRVLKKDIHNPHFICPPDLLLAHSETSVKVQKIMVERARKAENTRRIREEQRQLELLEKDKKSKAEYGEKIRPYAGLVITDSDLQIRPLMSIQEFMEEGAAMGHCVFSNRYYAHADCLILSAKDTKGERVETIEINTAEWRIVQSRAKGNGQSRYHEQIISLLEANMGKIQGCKRGRTPNRQRN